MERQHRVAACRQQRLPACKKQPAAEPAACEARDAARLQFIVAAEAFSAALAKGSALGGHVHRLSESVSASTIEHIMIDEELSKWRRVLAEADQLAVIAAEGKGGGGGGGGTGTAAAATATAAAAAAATAPAEAAAAAAAATTAAADGSGPYCLFRISRNG